MAKLNFAKVLSARHIARRDNNDIVTDNTYNVFLRKPSVNEMVRVSKINP